MKRDKLYLFAGVLWIVYTINALLAGLGPFESIFGIPLREPEVMILFLEFLLQLVLPVVGGCLLTVDCLRLWKCLTTKGLLVPGLLCLAADAVANAVIQGDTFASYVSVVYGALLVFYALQLGGKVGGTRWPCTVALLVVGIVLCIFTTLFEAYYLFADGPSYTTTALLVSAVIWQLVEFSPILLLTIGTHRKKTA